MADGTDTHRVSISVGDKTIDGWTEYEIKSSMIEPADSFTLTRPWSLAAWSLCKLDAVVKVAIDGVVVIDGRIDTRERDSKASTVTITGRDKVGRLVQTSIKSASGGLDGLTLVDAVKKLAAPEFSNVVLSNARNRDVRRGKGGRAMAQGEPAIFAVKGKLDAEHAGKVDPGEMRWNVIEQLCSSVGLMCWSSGDGREIVIGSPNYKQDPQYVLRHDRGRQGSTVKSLKITESILNRYAMIESFGSGRGDDEDYGEGVISHVGAAVNGPNPDGTGLDFLAPKRLAKSQTALLSNDEAKRDALREMYRRDFERRKISAECALHGQRFRSDVVTLFAPDTLARIVDTDAQLDIVGIIYECTYKRSKKNGSTTSLSLVPRGTVFVA